MQQALTPSTQASKPEMLTPFKTTLRTLYPEKEGWKLYNRFNWSTKVFDYVLQKEDGDITHRILVELNLEGSVTLDHFEKLHTLANRLDNGKCTLSQKIMIVDDSAQMAEGAGDIRVVLLSDLFKLNLLTGGTDRNKLVA